MSQKVDVKEVVRTHYSKEERQRVGAVLVEGLEGVCLRGYTRVGRRKWTVNRSPHGNKTAREQRGREEWKRRREVRSRKEGERRERRNGLGMVSQRRRREK